MIAIAFWALVLFLVPIWVYRTAKANSEALLKKEIASKARYRSTRPRPWIVGETFQ